MVQLLTLGLALMPLLQNVASRQFVIPQVAEVVSAMRETFGNETAYHGPKPAPKPALAPKPQADAPYWLAQIQHQGISAFGPGGYQVFRNVMDFGARGDGVTDDTAAINNAISSGGRCGQGCASSTTTPAVVYFPSGTYRISSPINSQYYTQLIGNPNGMPTIKGLSYFQGFALVDADPYYTQNLNWGSTNVFFRQIRNFIFDTTDIAAGSTATGIHWPTAQATSLQNLVFQMSTAAGNKHQGLFIESGSAGFLTDLTFNGGNIGAAVGNQQFTMRNLVFNNCNIALSHFWDWSWAYKSISINNCQVGIDISAGGSSGQQVGSITLFDSQISNTPIGIRTSFTSGSQPPAAGSVILENVVLNNVGVAIQGPSGTVLAGGSTTIAAWGEGHQYTPNGPNFFQGNIAPNNRPDSLLSGNKYLEMSKPQYQNLDTGSFRSVRSAGARGDGRTDDTAALQNVINSAAANNQVVFFDAGTYMVTNTIFMPANSKWVGETYPVIMSSGGYFNDINNPKPVVRVGNSGDGGQVQWSDMIVSTQGGQAGAILIEWNLATGGTPSGMWDVHTRVGGFAGSNLQVAQCPAGTQPNPNCMAAYMAMHVTPSANGIYMENVWLWTADHDIDSQGNQQISIFSGRGLYVESTAGTLWLYGTAVEHNALYQYQFANTQNIYMGQIQTETPYYQPVPNAQSPFPPVASLNDPDFAQSCAGKSGNCADAWGLRILNSKKILTYGAGLYSFFDNYSTTCSNQGNGEACQTSIFSVEGSSSDISVYNLNTVGSVSMVDVNGQSLARFSDNVNVFPDTMALFRK